MKSIHVTWEAPEGHVSIPSDDAEVGDDYDPKTGEITVGLDRQAKIDALEEKAAQAHIAAQEREDQKQQAILELEDNAKTIREALASFGTSEAPLSPQQAASKIVLQSGLEDLEYKLKILSGDKK